MRLLASKDYQTAFCITILAPMQRSIGVCSVGVAIV